MTEARAAILGRIRKAIGLRTSGPDEEYRSIRRTYQQESHLDRAQLVDLFASRIVHYDGSVLTCTAGSLAASVGQALSARGKTRIHVPPDIDSTWLPPGVEFVAHARATADELDQSEGVITGCAVAIALTGTIVLTHRRGEGRRALTLIPDYHLSVVFADQIVETVPEALRRAASRSHALMTTISGPSATADIEMTRIKGVHGPRVLDVVIVV